MGLKEVRDYPDEDFDVIAIEHTIGVWLYSVLHDWQRHSPETPL